MKKIIYTTLIIILISIIQLSVFNITSFASESTELETYSPACILIESSTGKIIYEKNAYEKLYPASTTKIMTAILTLENCELTDVATASYNSVYSIPAGYTNANIQVGEELTIDQLLHVLLIPSANDAAVVLAEHIAGSVDNFANMMNEKAKELGCLNTHFVNPNGIHNENHYSTAYDLALIGKYAYENNIIKSIVSKQSYSLPKNTNHPLYNTTNALLKNSSKYHYEYANGFKTGYTDAAGYCIIATASKDGIDLICVILKGEYLADGTATRESDCINLFNYGFENYKSVKLLNEGDIVRTISVLNGTDDTKSLDIKAASNLNCAVFTDEVVDVTPVIQINNMLAPIAQGQVVGSITYTIDEVDYKSDLIATHDVYSSNVMNVILALFAIFAVLLVIVTIISIKKK